MSPKIDSFKVSLAPNQAQAPQKKPSTVAPKKEDVFKKDSVSVSNSNPKQPAKAVIPLHEHRPDYQEAAGISAQTLGFIFDTAHPGFCVLGLGGTLVALPKSWEHTKENFSKGDAVGTGSALIGLADNATGVVFFSSMLTHSAAKSSAAEKLLGPRLAGAIAHRSDATANASVVGFTVLGAIGTGVFAWDAVDQQRAMNAIKDKLKDAKLSPADRQKLNEALSTLTTNRNFSAGATVLSGGYTVGLYKALTNPKLANRLFPIAILSGAASLGANALSDQDTRKAVKKDFGTIHKLGN